MSVLLVESCNPRVAVLSRTAVSNCFHLLLYADVHLDFSLCLAAEINSIHHLRDVRVSLPGVAQDRLQLQVS